MTKEAQADRYGQGSPRPAPGQALGSPTLAEGFHEEQGVRQEESRDGRCSE